MTKSTFRLVFLLFLVVACDEPQPESSQLDPEVLNRLEAKCGETGDLLVGIVRQGAERTRARGVRVTDSGFAQAMSDAIGMDHRPDCGPVADSVASGLPVE